MRVVFVSSLVELPIQIYFEIKQNKIYASAHSTLIHNSNQWFQHAAIWHTRSSDANFYVWIIWLFTPLSLHLSLYFSACRSFTQPCNVHVQNAMPRQKKRTAKPCFLCTSHHCRSATHTHTKTHNIQIIHTHPWMQKNTILCHHYEYFTWFPFVAAHTLWLLTLKIPLKREKSVVVEKLRFFRFVFEQINVNSVSLSSMEKQQRFSRVKFEYIIYDCDYHYIWYVFNGMCMWYLKHEIYIIVHMDCFLCTKDITYRLYDVIVVCFNRIVVAVASFTSLSSIGNVSFFWDSHKYTACVSIAIENNRQILHALVCACVCACLSLWLKIPFGWSDSESEKLFYESEIDFLFGNQFV